MKSCNKAIITKKSLIKAIAKQTNKNISDVKNFYNTLESVIFDTLSSVDENQDVCIKLFEGINLEGVYFPEKTKRNNLTGKTNYIDSRIKPKFNITRSYCDKLNSQ